MTTATAALPLTPANYHSAPGVSHSRLEKFRKRRHKFHAVYIAGTLDDDEATPDQVVGTLTDILVLTPERWHELVAPPRPHRAPDGKKWLCRKGSKHEAWNAEWEASCAGKVKAKQEQVSLAQAMRRAVFDSPMAASLLDDFAERGGKAQRILTWTDEATGLECRSMNDLWLPERNMIVELKTTDDASPEPWDRTARKYGYNRQAEFYVRGHHEVTGEIPVFAFIVVASSPPHEVGVYFPDDPVLRLAGRQNNSDLYDYAECVRTNDWRADWEKSPQPMTLKKWEDE